MLSSRSATPRIRSEYDRCINAGTLRSEETMRSKFLADCDPHHREYLPTSSCCCHGGGSLEHPALVPELRQTNGHYANYPRQPRDS